MKIAIIGLGEVGGYYAMGLASGGADVCAYSIHMNDPAKAERLKKYAASGVKLCYTAEDAVKSADIIISVTTSKAAITTAESVKPYLNGKQIYIECNSAVPNVKKEISVLLEGAAIVIDGTTMASVNQLKHRTPVNLSGPHADEVSKILNSYGMNTSCVGDLVGQASALKVLRSVFMKGFEVVLVECMQASNVYGVADAVLKSILDFFDTKPLPELMNMFITTDAIHCKRRGEELKSIVSLLDEQNIECTMSKAGVKKLMWVSSLNMNEYFGGNVPENIQPVLDILSSGKAVKEAE